MANLEELKAIIEEELDNQQETEEKYPLDVPNDVCRHAFIRGIPIENSFGPKVGEYNYLCQIGRESVFLWTYKEDTNSSLVSQVDLAVKDDVFWKTAGNLIWLANVYYHAYEGASTEFIPDYKWMFYFDPSTSTIDSTVFYGLTDLERNFISNGTILKATDIADYAPLLDLLFRDDKAFTALSLVCTAFCTHPCCLICEMSEHPWHDHIAEEPKKWEQANMLPSLEVAIVQSCRAVEAIIGEPPNRKKESKVAKHKQHWIDTVGIDPDSQFTKAGKSYLDFYYELFFELRNPSAHSYGNIHFELKRKRTVEAQCFAAIILREYITKNILDYYAAIEKLKFNKSLLDRVSSKMSTSTTLPKE